MVTTIRKILERSSLAFSMNPYSVKVIASFPPAFRSFFNLSASRKFFGILFTPFIIRFTVFWRCAVISSTLFDFCWTILTCLTFESPLFCMKDLAETLPESCGGLAATAVDDNTANSTAIDNIKKFGMIPLLISYQIVLLYSALLLLWVLSIRFPSIDIHFLVDLVVDWLQCVLVDRDGMKQWHDTISSGSIRWFGCSESTHTEFKLFLNFSNVFSRNFFFQLFMKCESRFSI